MLSSAFLSATNHLLSQSGWARTRLQPHAGRTARLAIAPLAELDFSVSAEGYLAAWSGEDAPEVLLRLAAVDLPRLLVDGLETAMRHVRIEGNAEFADALGFVFRHLRWDAEEDLSRVFGDIAAHRLVEGGKHLVGEGRRSLERVSGNLAEYLTEESPLLVPRNALAELSQDVIALRDALGRLDKRVSRLEGRR
ncbi:Ubiquinone biosynthesis accessory factor UbiJ [Thauera humireducens]|jgi:ubiquinone biosynthesis protein UbiJ|uniref:ubiquinone biosynthesis accessory factor UbiJ n=1 Tax=Thauera humireducens TaxID=1134435 RepID=UPI002467AB5F|nr:SCP2 sterol-binding domain-containing protein [Thauera humireducens]CAH1746578.1 Ubiquinone biosynthesis accessory factor UbiJ [Thauera humireducens]